MTEATIKFNTGQTYSTRSTGDHNCIYSVTVASRTRCTIKDSTGKVYRIVKGETEWAGAESILPHGRHSMCSIIRADSKDLRDVLTYTEGPDGIHEDTMLTDEELHEESRMDILRLFCRMDAIVAAGLNRRNRGEQIAREMLND